MECSRHADAEVIGYCYVCGEFGCDTCLTKHESSLYCARHYRPIAEQLEEEKRHEDVRKKHVRKRLVVRYVDGKVQHGVCFALNSKERGFHLDLVDKAGASVGKTVPVSFEDLKAVYYVKSFDGKFDKDANLQETQAEGGEAFVKFRDGEVVRGRLAQPYDPNKPRFRLVPIDPKSNNISILVENAAVEGVYTPDEYVAKSAQERDDHVAKPAQERHDHEPAVCQEEGLGDLYTQMRDYHAALEQYRLAAAKAPDSRRIRKKMTVSEYNLGVNFIKRHEYQKALACMELVLQQDPSNELALRKVAQLHKAIHGETHAH